jgi:hypothetical protein
VVVLAGYQKQMEDNLLAYNDGLPSRFPQVFKFPDYSDEELLSIMAGMLRSMDPQFAAEDVRHLRIAARRLGLQRGSPGFGNARAVRNFVEQAISRQSGRVVREEQQGLRPDLLALRREDLLGPRGVDVESSEALRELEGMRGLERVKASARMLVELIRTNAELEDQEKAVKRVGLNRVFLGNPGTGGCCAAAVQHGWPQQ